MARGGRRRTTRPVRHCVGDEADRVAAPVSLEHVGKGFQAVDRSVDPHRYVNYLDVVGALSAFQRYKKQTFDLLALRAGGQFLDVGCGNGDDVRTMAGTVGSSGRVVGLDRSAALVAEASARTGEEAEAVEFRVGEASELDFADASFDGCRADRVFQHLDAPERALHEMTRVTRTGGRIVVSDTDWETLVIDAPDPALTRRILNFVCDSCCNGWAGRKLPGLFKGAGLGEVAATPVTLVLTDYRMACQVFALETAMAEAARAGVVPTDAVRRWSESLEERDAAGRFFSAATGFIVSGRRP